MKRRSLLKILGVAPAISFVDIAKADKEAAFKSTSDTRKMGANSPNAQFSTELMKKFSDEFYKSHKKSRLLTSSESLLRSNGDTIRIKRPNTFKV